MEGTLQELKTKHDSTKNLMVQIMYYTEIIYVAAKLCLCCSYTNIPHPNKLHPVT